jgi:hypothetical protein
MSEKMLDGEKFHQGCETCTIICYCILVSTPLHRMKVPENVLTKVVPFFDTPKNTRIEILLSVSLLAT